MVIFETFALVKLLKKEPGHEKVAARLKLGGIISEATLYELTYVTTRDFLEQGHDLGESVRRAREIANSLLVYLKRQALTDSIITEAVALKIKYNKLNLSHFDCLALATAKVLQQPLFSGEQGLKQVKEVEMVS